jgi:hypothetical protein
MEVLCSNFGRDTDYPEMFRDFHQSLQANDGIRPQALPNIFQFIIHLSCHYPPVYSVDTDSVVK